MKINLFIIGAMCKCLMVCGLVFYPLCLVVDFSMVKGTMHITKYLCCLLLIFWWSTTSTSCINEYSPSCGQLSPKGMNPTTKMNQLQHLCFLLLTIVRNIYVVTHLKVIGSRYVGDFPSCDYSYSQLIASHHVLIQILLQ